MSLVAAAVCPHPPILVPAVGAGEPVAARAPALAAVRWLLDRDAQVLIVVGDGPTTGPVRAGTTGSFAGFGVPERVTLGSPGAGSPGGPAPALALSLSVGAWLLDAAGGPRPPGRAVRGFTVSADRSPAEAAGDGADLAGAADRVALLVMGDGSARRTPRAPGGFDQRAAAFDAAAAAALAAGDPAGLLALDPVLGRELLAAGRASWQVLAGAATDLAEAATHSNNDADAQSRGALRNRDLPADPANPLCRSVVSKSLVSYVTYDDAPYGVGYLVATWERGV